MSGVGRALCVRTAPVRRGWTNSSAPVEGDGDSREGSGVGALLILIRKRASRGLCWNAHRDASPVAQDLRRRRRGDGATLNRVASPSND